MAQLQKEWFDMLCPETQAKLDEIENAVANLESNGEIVYPPAEDRYNAFNARPDEVRVVIIGQDPYFRPGQAMGLCFSVPKGVKVPPSLKNIYKELGADYPSIFDEMPNHGDLSSWAEQGVLLLNTALTVEEGKAGSHEHLGWNVVTSEIVHQLSHHYPNIAFVLWGKHAQGLKPFINPDSFVIESSHPSSIGGACYKGFFGSRSFSRVNAHLASIGVDEIDWRIDN